MRWVSRCVWLLSVSLLSADGLADGVHSRLEEAVKTAGTNYILHRDQLVAGGTDAMAELTVISTDTSRTWQVRLMASIVVERIRRGEEVTEIAGKNWREDPEYKREWEQYREGPVRGLSTLVLKRYRERELWAYYIEQIWKETGEHSRTGMNEWSWRGVARNAVKESPLLPLLLQVLAERVSSDIQFSSYERWGEFNVLLESATNTVLPQLLKIIQNAPLNNRNAAWRKMANTVAQPEDAPLIEKYFRDKEQEVPEALVEPLKELEERAERGRPSRAVINPQGDRDQGDRDGPRK